MKPCHGYILLFCLTVSAIHFSSCKNQEAKAENKSTGDTAMVIKKVFHTLTIDTSRITKFLKDYPLFGFHGTEIRSFYQNRDQQSAWFNDYGIVEQGGFFMNLLDHFGDEGIKDSVIYYSRLKTVYNQINSPNYSYSGADSLTTEFELMLTAEFFVYAQRVWYGLSEKTTKELDWYITRKTVPSVSILDSILTGGKNSFTAYEPIYPQYNLLKNYLKKYKALEDMPWDSLKLPAGMKSLKHGDSADVIIKMKERLFLLGDLDVNDSTFLFDDAFSDGVKKFQSRHGLTSDGVAGGKFFAELNYSPAERIKQIEINMERCRWIPNDPEGDYIIVNIPEYSMHIFADDTLAWDQKVVVGKTSTGTTIFNDELEYIVFSPYWIPPPSILNNEILPSLKKNSGYLKKENMEAFDASGKTIDVSGVDWNKYTTMPYRIRQKPGGSNSLGWVKFIFPNEHNIYFHDTPSRDLFSKESRNFSHGCIRVAEPKRFAEYLLRNDSTYTTKKIDSLYYLGRETYVKLQEKIPVYIVYFTAWVDGNGQLNFRKDIYGHDAKLGKTLFGEISNNEQGI